MTKYEPVIGLEVHVELNTKSKMFCRCSADYFGKEPNTHTCPVCLGLPGALPYINEEAINGCIKIGLALNCQISKKSLFERKNYFYPDLPKGYQISQYRWPLCVDGLIEVEGREGIRRIRINRVHQEEDTAKLTHQFVNQKSTPRLPSTGSATLTTGSLRTSRSGQEIKNQNETLIDFNRSGVPLVEIVTEPDFKEVEEIKDYAKKLQQLFRYLGVSNADMERGDMRLEANVSVRKVKSQKPKVKSNELPNYRVELKNINSFRFMVAAVEYEIKRQIEVLEGGEKLHQETRGWDEDKKCTYVQRSKEEAHDYRYFPEPDLPELKIEESRVKSLESSLPELPWDKAKKYQSNWGIKKADALILSEDKKLAEFFEQAVEYGKKHRLGARGIANFIINRKVDIEQFLPAQIVEQLRNSQIGVIGDRREIEELAKQVIKENPKASQDYKKGKEAALQVLIGGIMRLSKGKADVSQVKPLLENLLRE